MGIRYFFLCIFTFLRDQHVGMFLNFLSEASWIVSHDRITYIAVLSLWRR